VLVWLGTCQDKIVSYYDKVKKIIEKLWINLMNTSVLTEIFCNFKKLVNSVLKLSPKLPYMRFEEQQRIFIERQNIYLGFSFMVENNYLINHKSLQKTLQHYKATEFDCMWILKCIWYFWWGCNINLIRIYYNISLGVTNLEIFTENMRKITTVWYGMWLLVR